MEHRIGLYRLIEVVLLDGKEASVIFLKRRFVYKTYERLS